MKLYKIFCCNIYKGGFWFRIFMRGLAIDNRSPMFSERYGYRKVVRIFGWRIEYLHKY